jgi:excisionase family DNA binding protein
MIEPAFASAVDPVPYGGGRFHPERVELFWLGQGSMRMSASRVVPPPVRRRSQPDDQFTSAQAAAFLGLNDQYVLRLIRRSDLRADRGPRGWLITQTALDAFLAERRLQPSRS